jgi:hypothetical protein
VVVAEFTEAAARSRLTYSIVRMERLKSDTLPTPDFADLTEKIAPLCFRKLAPCSVWSFGGQCSLFFMANLCK